MIPSGGGEQHEDSGGDAVIGAAQMELDHSVAPGKDLEFLVRPWLPVVQAGPEQGLATRPGAPDRDCPVVSARVVAPGAIAGVVDWTAGAVEARRPAPAAS